ncbi:hypothetical protein IKS38_08290 [bacterium]|nr:hypothetical protein [bacterium]
MFRAKYLIPLLLFAVYLILEAGYLVGKRIAPDYPNIRTSDVKEAVSVTRGRTTYQIYPVDLPNKGMMFLNYFGSLKGKTDRLPEMEFALVSEAEKETLLNPDTAASHFKKVLSTGDSVAHSAFQRRRHFLLRQTVPNGGKCYLVVGNVAPTVLKGERIFFFVANAVEKMKSFWPYALLFFRNFIIVCLILFFTFLIYAKTRGFWRLATVFLSCGILAFIAAFTPFNVFCSAIEGPKAKNLIWKDLSRELRQGSEVLRIPLETCSPYSACFIRVKGRAVDSSEHSLVYTDLYKAPSYDNPSTENLMTFFKEKTTEKLYLFDSAHSFFDDISLRFWHEGRGGAAVIENVRLTEAKLPSGIMKVLLSVSESFLACFWIFWFVFFLTSCFLIVYFKRNFYSKLASFILAFISLSILLAPIYSFGHKEPMMATTNERFLLGLKPLSFYALVWHNEPKPDILPEELEAPMSGNLTVASYSDKVLGARPDIYPDNTDTFLRFFTHTFSNIRINVQRELVVLKDFRLVKLNDAYLALRMIAWLWLIVLILGSFWQAARLIAKGDKA